MDIIMKEDFDDLGLEGDIVSVAKGYARNFLIPKGIAVEATPQNQKAFELKRKKIEVKRLKAKEEAEKLKSELESMEITFSHKAGEEGRLYGSVTSSDVAAQLEAQGVVIDRRKIVMDRPIKALGEYTLSVKIYPEVVGSIKVTVIAEEEETEEKEE